VRPINETDVAPDAYASGDPVALVPYALAPAALGQTPKPPHTVNYALVDRVQVEPQGDGVGRLRIDGIFSMQGGDGPFYDSPARGYLYLAGTRTAPDWQDWATAAGTGQVVRFYVFSSSDASVRLRRADESPGAPDRLPTWGRTAPTPIMTDTEYLPIRLLREQR
jgi:hypothetical protein